MWDGASPIIPPANLELEQALLGGLLLKNGRPYETVSEIVEPGHFSLPVHGRIFEAIGKLVDRGEPATPPALKRLFDADTALEEIGGASYLVRIATAAPGFDPAHYARQIRDLYIRRALIERCQETIADALQEDLDRTGEKRVEDAETRLASLVGAKEGRQGVKTAAEAADRHLADVEAAYKAGGKITGLTTGIASLDRLLGGLKPGHLYFLGARPSMGKSALAGVLAFHVAKSAPVGIASLEMTDAQWVGRWIAKLTGIPDDKQGRGDLSVNDWHRITEAVGHIKELPIAIDDSAGVTVAQIRQRARRLARRNRLGLLIVDHINIIRGSAETARGGGDTAIVTEITRELKACAKELDVPVLALSQLSRDVERRDDKRPQLADLRQSGSIEQDADVVMFLYRKAYYLEREKPERRANETAEKFADREAQWTDDLDGCRNLADLIVAKHRGGPIGNLKLYFDGARSLFTDLAGHQ